MMHEITKFIYINKINELINNDKLSFNNKFENTCEIFNVLIDFLTHDFNDELYMVILEKTEEKMGSQCFNEEQKNYIKNIYNKKLINMYFTRYYSLYNNDQQNESN